MAKTCPKCGAVVALYGGRRRQYCIPCERTQQREYAARYRRARVKPLLCADCGITMVRRVGQGHQLKRCPPCWKANQLALSRKNGRLKWQRFPERMKSQKLKQRYGLTLAEWNKRLALQGDKCAICIRPFGDRKRCTDHDHITKRVRGIVCSSCNTRLAWFESRRSLILNYLADPSLDYEESLG